MRTSGAATETNMIVAMGVIALLVAMVLAGGPRELMLALESMLSNLAEAIYQAWLRFAR